MPRNELVTDNRGHSFCLSLSHN